MKLEIEGRERIINFKILSKGCKKAAASLDSLREAIKELQGMTEKVELKERFECAWSEERFEVAEAILNRLEEIAPKDKEVIKLRRLFNLYT